MLKKMILAAVPMMFLVSIASADDFLAGFDVSAIQDADISIDEAGFDVDFDKLADDVGDDEAIEACFRSYGYNSYRSYGYSSYDYGYNCYRPTYYSCYRPVYYNTCYTPVYRTCYRPVYRSYWGCW